MNSELVPLTLTIKVKLAFTLQWFLKKIEPFFTTPSNLKCDFDHLLDFSNGARLKAGGGDTCFLRIQKRPSQVSLNISVSNTKATTASLVLNHA